MPAEAAATPSSSVSALQQRIDELSVELRARTAERDEAVQRERALAEVLQAINASAQVPTAVFEVILEKVMHLCAAAFGYLMTYDGERFQVVASHSLPARFAEYLRNMDQPGSTGLYSAIRRGAPHVQAADLREGEVYRTSSLRRALVDLGGARTGIVVALRKDDSLLGVITIYRQEVRPFTDMEIALLQNFAEQAVIAIDNSRLLVDLRESEARHALVSDAVAEGIYEWNIETNALWVSQRLIEIFGFEGRELNAADWNKLVHPEDFSRYRSALRDCFKGTTRRLDCEYRVRHADGAYRWIEDRGVPVRNAARRAIRLVGALTDVTARKESEDALREALERQTATSDVLQVINASPGRLEPVFDAMLERAVRLCAADAGVLATFDGRHFHVVAVLGFPGMGEFPRGPLDPHPETGNGRVAAGEKTVHILDSTAGEAFGLGDPGRRAIVELGGARTQLCVSLHKDDEVLGTFTIWRREVRSFDDNQIALLESFAAQAVIAMENARLLTEQREALERQTATAEVLQAINSSPGNLAPVFETILEKAHALCRVALGSLQLYDGTKFRAVAVHSLPDPLARRLREGYVPVPIFTGRLIDGAGFAHFPDIAEIDDPMARATVEGGIRTLLTVALRKDGKLLGQIVSARKEVRPFADKDIALLQSFAAQAVIAMENARLLAELRQRTGELARTVEELTATGDVLKTISRSSTDLKIVLDSLLETVARLCRADYTHMFRRHENLHHLLAAYGLPPEGEAFVRSHPFAPGRGTTVGRVAMERRAVHIEDVLSDPEYNNNESQRISGFRTMLGIPLIREDTLVGIFVLGRTRVEPFTAKEIELANSFADQAVIAIENARLFEELRDRQAELRVTFDNMGDGVAMFDGDHRLGAWNRNFEQIMGLSEEWLVRRPGYAEYLEILAERGEFGTENVEAELASRLEDTERELRLERTRADGSVIEVRRNAVPGGGFVLIYSDISERRRAEAEIRAARDAAEEALEQQTATAEILRAISQSPTDVQPVLDAVVKAAVRFCGATDAVIILREGDAAVFAAHEGPLSTPLGSSLPLNRETAPGRAISDGRTCHLPDIASLDPVEFAAAHRFANAHGFCAAVSAPMMHKSTAIGAVALRKPETGPFAPRQIELLETFAAQAVIAIENVRLFTELRDSLKRLRAAQANLIQAEKMASLGQLTAGIAHEIKNPLNFVNNFAGLSVELLDELKEAAAPVLAGMNEDARGEFAETVELLTGNLRKIAEHGRRADGIVKSMLSHSRGGTGDWQESNINALVEEALNLAYHGARAQDKDFNVTLERDFTLETKSIEVVPQDVTRVFLNLFGNGFYATRKRHLGGANAGYRPTLRVSTRDLGEAVEVRVRDNGTGIQPEVRAKLFQPFFTTKPTGEGTGLGLSISYDIVTQQHGGSIDVESEPGSFTEFTVRLPRSRRVAQSRGA